MIGRMSFFLLFSCLAFQMLGCSKRENLLFIVPDGFQGAIRVVPNSLDGVDPQRENGALVFEIPASGVLKIKGPSPFKVMHTAVARFKSGKAIVYNTGVLRDQEDNDADIVYMTEFGMDERSNSWLYVCPSISESRAAMGADLEPGKRIVR